MTFDYLIHMILPAWGREPRGERENGKSYSKLSCDYPLCGHKEIIQGDVAYDRVRNEFYHTGLCPVRALAYARNHGDLDSKVGVLENMSVEKALKILKKEELKQAAETEEEVIQV